RSIPLQDNAELCQFLSNLDINETDQQGGINTIRTQFEQNQNKWAEKKNTNERKYITAASNGVGAIFSFAATFLATRPEIAAAGTLSVIAVLTHDVALTALGFLAFGAPVGVISAFIIHWVGHTIYDHSHPQPEMPDEMKTENADKIARLKEKVQLIETEKSRLESGLHLRIAEKAQLNLAIRKFKGIIAQSYGDSQVSSALV
ncbi:MAG: hypothetical protein ACI8RA_000649, partial [Chlamydiales bacterium]